MEWIVALFLGTTAPAVATQNEAAAQFWLNMAQHCGQAFEGRRVIARDDRPDLLEGNERLIVHFRECSSELLALPFHIGAVDGSWDRSRTWRYSWQDGQLELRHDHRLNTGAPDESNTMYGGLSIGQGTPEQQQFLFTERTAEDGSALGWRIEIVPGERYTYGTFSGDNWTWRLDFDLSKPLEKLPPAPWGHE
ncbi:hypothetical protein [Alkalimonas amylolytica]|uniref:DUF1579 domain-containing protein n=1 Tax=Alkalimonas amylolytica TaxID=152573 RepID=A0A1H4BFL0_ALKAM|nr:hypothetical protein [Alkalimonas amylolytica]SEA46995.1 hypothetical protein SAMN04488051_103339 [Alkalimonas amylolytica]